jgi:hypothetical protein
MTGRTHEANAAILEMEAKAAKKSGGYEEAKLLKEKKQMAGAQRAAYAKSGVLFTEGSPLEVMADSATAYAMDISAKRYNTATTVAQKEYEARHKRSLGEYYTGPLASMYRKAGYMQAGATLLTGAGELAGM